VYNGSVYQLFVGCEKACDSIRRDILYNILIEMGIPLKLVRLMEPIVKFTYVEICLIYFH